MSARQTGCLGFGKSSFMGAVGADTLTGEGDRRYGKKMDCVYKKRGEREASGPTQC